MNELLTQMSLPTIVPKVSVVMITYNHEPFIERAIQSVLMQQTNFPLELVIGEDCSTDGTRRIVEHYSRLRPDIVRPLYHSQNLGMHKNLRAALAMCRGEYTAFLEGDDYWTDPAKLNTQSAVLDNNERVALTWHSLRLIDSNDKRLHQLPANKHTEAIETLDELLHSGLPGTASVLMRRQLIDLVALTEFEDFPQADYAIWMLACRDGRVAHYNPRCMAVYRRHSGGVTSSFSRPEVMISLARMWELLAVRANVPAKEVVKRNIWLSYHHASRGFADEGRLKAAFTALFHSAQFAAMPPSVWLREYGKCAVRTCIRRFRRPGAKEVA